MTRRRSSPRSRSRPGARPSKGSGRLRIIGGEYRRRLLPVLDSPGLRPTPDRVRETLFNWLAAATPGAQALDLFAGTGALGLEALSRGAASVLFVERDARVAGALADNLRTLGASERGRVQAGDALALLAAGSADAAFTLVFLDPPFRQGLAEPCCEYLERGWLAAEAWIYLEAETALDVHVPANWALHREVRAGDSTGRLYRRR
ncbi:16S rRNA (guanine(966)-N(2))-methyltransferase RsmD [Halomonas sp. MCCC 1A17488]|uniref:Ribosomal RNA small subunit methyltransferase D n=1 Tax=Billgrantia sulfidoxydans TaxID=2733484 RepID=A0ABX7W1Q8_9GAMM|nr:MULTISPECIES: 16S rRNA (guanine(966)-N(2))-methyltransferase RsmD [Halomonas]MCE8016782.1 16S rRNA (guanine(966)-N(2))-methyltransferase RsmD [Halomonas sp. MCCC 1A17488]MCG3240115.1 16S rRNA (guanine(966)-N(2))-methyltransferase RsmD [Halomonas sp. MCCC 1A17488]QPP50004.1 16S rRNA (guanine(966)-N(2))-methyltransferase RsmD [Halomonas sp. SS10-MC5]QTP53617.1 16S rRNA (guanine(966)-N(2))-methyltransferase RsmD [Halomonas sulfidoxydans]